MGADPAVDDESSGAGDLTILVDEEDLGGSPEVRAAWVVSGTARAAKWLALRGQTRNPSGDDYLIALEGNRAMVAYWRESKLAGQDAYIDLLVDVDELGFLEEYVIVAFGKLGWTVPGESMQELDVPGFLAWARQNLTRHRPESKVSIKPANAGAWPDPPGRWLPPVPELDESMTPCHKPAELEAIVARWAAEAAGLDGRPLAADSAVQFLDILGMIGKQEELGKSGATWVPTLAYQFSYVAGFCAIERKDLGAAQKHLRMAVSLFPLSAQARSELAHLYIQQRKFYLAMAEVEAVLAMTDDPCDVARSLRKIGFIQFEQGKLRDAHATYSKSLEYEPGSQVALSELRVLRKEMISAGWTNLPPEVYTPPTNRQLTTTCTLPPPDQFD